MKPISQLLEEILDLRLTIAYCEKEILKKEIAIVQLFGEFDSGLNGGEAVDAFLEARNGDPFSPKDVASWIADRDKQQYGSREYCRINAAITTRYKDGRLRKVAEGTYRKA